MKAGDVVLHRPTTEKWVLGAVEDCRVYPLGWPECIAQEADCELVESCSPAEHLDTLRRVADGASSSARARAAWRNLDDGARAVRAARSSEA